MIAGWHCTKSKFKKKYKCVGQLPEHFIQPLLTESAVLALDGGAAVLV